MFSFLDQNHTGTFWRCLCPLLYIHMWWYLCVSCSSYLHSLWYFFLGIHSLVGQRILSYPLEKSRFVFQALAVVKQFGLQERRAEEGVAWGLCEMVWSMNPSNLSCNMVYHGVDWNCDFLSSHVPVSIYFLIKLKVASFHMRGQIKFQHPCLMFEVINHLSLR